MLGSPLLTLHAVACAAWFSSRQETESCRSCNRHCAWPTLKQPSTSNQPNCRAMERQTSTTSRLQLKVVRYHHPQRQARIQGRPMATFIKMTRAAMRTGSDGRPGSVRAASQKPKLRKARLITKPGSRVNWTTSSLAVRFTVRR